MSKYFYHPHLDINLFILKLKEYQNVIYLQLRRVNLHATVTSEWSHVAKGEFTFYTLDVHRGWFIQSESVKAVFIRISSKVNIQSDQWTK